MSSSENMKSISEIIEIIEYKETIIPLLQRNYKWTMECAAELSEDLWESFKKDKNKIYQLNMITIYEDEKNNRFQILDGQQRIITLKLLLAFLEPDKVNLNFLFERDFKIEERKSRKYFIEKILKDDLFFKRLENSYQFSVDTKRLYNNFMSMILPISFRDILEIRNDIYNEKLKNSTNNESSVNKSEKSIFKEKIGHKEFLKDKLPIKIEYEDISLSEDDIDKIWKLCELFYDKSDTNNKDEEDSNDEVRISKYSQKFMDIWTDKVKRIACNNGISYLREKISEEDRIEFVNYIKEKVEVLYHNTTSEPIDEFLNINENKTRFVISDYIRASMISDKPIENKDEELTINHKKNREDILRVFKNISNYLYSEEYKDMWNLIRTRYSDFEEYGDNTNSKKDKISDEFEKYKHKDINRLKIVFCDRYSGTSTRGYEFEKELKTLKYFEFILENLSDELDCLNNKESINKNYSTYNAVYALLECKSEYRFFSLFNQDDIEKTKILEEVTAKERFGFFEWAYKYIESSENPWHISYFLESQLYDEKCNIKKYSSLPKTKTNTDTKNYSDWHYISKGSESDKLYNAIKEIVKCDK